MVTAHEQERLQSHQDICSPVSMPESPQNSTQFQIYVLRDICKIKVQQREKLHVMW